MSALPDTFKLPLEVCASRLPLMLPSTLMPLELTSFALSPLTETLPSSLPLSDMVMFTPLNVVSALVTLPVWLMFPEALALRDVLAVVSPKTTSPEDVISIFPAFNSDTSTLPPEMVKSSVASIFSVESIFPFVPELPASIFTLLAVISPLFKIATEYKSPAPNNTLPEPASILPLLVIPLLSAVVFLTTTEIPVPASLISIFSPDAITTVLPFVVMLPEFFTVLPRRYTPFAVMSAWFSRLPLNEKLSMPALKLPSVILPAAATRLPTFITALAPNNTPAGFTIYTLPLAFSAPQISDCGPDTLTRFKTTAFASAWLNVTLASFPILKLS